MPAAMPFRLAGLTAVASLAIAGSATASSVPRSALVAGSGDAPAVALFDPHGASVGSLSPLGAAPALGADVASAELDGDHAGDVVTGSGAGMRARVVVTDGRTGAAFASFKPYAAGMLGGVRVAAGDVTGDGRADILVAPAADPGPVQAFNRRGAVVLRSFYPYDPAFAGGVSVAAGDVDGDGVADIVTAPAHGAGTVKVFSGATGALLRSFYPYDPAFAGGVRVAAGDLDGDGRAEVVTVPAGGAAAYVRAFSGATGAPVAAFFAFGPANTTGATVAVGDVTRDGRPDIVVGSGPGATALVRAFDGRTLAALASFAPFQGAQAAGVAVAVQRLGG